MKVAGATAIEARLAGHAWSSMGWPVGFFMRWLGRADAQHSTIHSHGPCRRRCAAMAAARVLSALAALVLAGAALAFHLPRAHFWESPREFAAGDAIQGEQRGGQRVLCFV